MKYRIAVLIYLLLISLGAAQVTPEFASRNLWQNNEASASGSKGGSRGKYVLLSLLVPGAGQWFMGQRTRAKFFLGTEIALWAGYWGVTSYTSVLKKDFMAYAAAYAQVNTVSKPDKYWAAIGTADDIYSYNEKQRVERNLAGTYPENDAYYWQWDASENRYKYNELRIKQHDWERRATFMISGFILNRLISAVDVVRIIRKQNREAREQQSRLFFDYRDDRLAGETFRLNFVMAW